jgi:hypothetical protein
MDGKGDRWVVERRSAVERSAGKRREKGELGTREEFPDHPALKWDHVSFL